jgi:hypothetical protein
MLEASIDGRADNVLRLWKVLDLRVSAGNVVHKRQGIDHRGGVSLQSGAIKFPRSEKNLAPDVDGTLSPLLWGEKYPNDYCERVRTTLDKCYVQKKHRGTSPLTPALEPDLQRLQRRNFEGL